MAVYEDLRSAGIGHNSGASGDVFERLTARDAELTRTANIWIANTKAVEDQETADALSGFLKQVTLLRSDADAARKNEKQPHLDAARAVDEKWRPLIERCDNTKRLLEPRLQAYLQKKRREQEEEARRQREEAERKRREAEEAQRRAEELIRAAEAGTLDEGTNVVGAIQRAEEVAREAEAAAKAAEKAASAKVMAGGQYTVGGRKKSTSLRTYTTVKVVDLKACAAYLVKIKAPELVEACEKAARRLYRANPEAPIPGTEVVTEERIAL